MQEPVSVIIPAHNEAATNEAVVRKLRGLPWVDEVVVVDNASEDGSAEAIAAWIDAQPTGTPVKLVSSETNSGFSGGHNQGIRACDAEFYLLLNSDALLRPGFCANILAAAEARPKDGLFAPRIEHDDGDVQTSCFRYWGQGQWTDYAGEIYNRGLATIQQGF